MALAGYRNVDDTYKYMNDEEDRGGRRCACNRYNFDYTKIEQRLAQPSKLTFLLTFVYIFLLIKHIWMSVRCGIVVVCRHSSELRP